MDLKGVWFTPLSDVDEVSSHAHLLQLGSFRILLDAGWDESFSAKSLAGLMNAAPDIDAVLLSQPDLEHLGALPVLVSSYGLTAPIYSTMPTCRLGRLALHGARSIRTVDSGFDAFSGDDIDKAFDRVQQLRWRQTVALTGRGEGITITPYAAGRLLGGSIWNISQNGEEYIYAVDMNHRKERLLNGATLEQLFNRPALLITDSPSVGRPEPPRSITGRNAQRPVGGSGTGRGRGRGREGSGARDNAPQAVVAAWEAEMMEVVMRSLRGNGRVLIAMDAVGRILELVLALEAAWAADQLPYAVIVVGALSAAALLAAGSQVEWMSDGLQRSFETNHKNPFNFRHVKAVASIEEADRLLQGAAVVIAPAASLEAGPSRRLLAQWGQSSCNTIIFPGRPKENTLAAEIVAAAAKRVKGASAAISFALHSTEQLHGAELAAYEAAAVQAEPSAVPEPLPTTAGDAGQPGTSPTAKEDKEVHGEGADMQSSSPQQRNSSGSVNFTTPAAGQREWDIVIEGFTVPDGAAAPMFPDIDEMADLDIGDYGASIESLGFGNEDADGSTVGAAIIPESATKQQEHLSVSIPTKVFVENIQMDFKAQVVVLPAAEGRSDWQSHRTIVEHLAPRHLVIVHGSPGTREELSAHCKRELSSLHTAVYTPSQGQQLQLSIDQEAFRIGLAPSLADDLKLQAVGKYQLAWVSTTAAADGQSVELSPLDASTACGSSHQGGVFIGDVKLSDLKAALTTAGIPSEWEGPGALVAARGQVRIRLVGGARAAGSGTEVATASNLAGLEKDNAAILVEGSLCGEYFTVRDLLYGQYHVC